MVEPLLFNMMLRVYKQLQMMRAAQMSICEELKQLSEDLSRLNLALDRSVESKPEILSSERVVH